jgi:hypothetical protein
MKSKHQEERGLWVPSSSKGRLLDPHKLALLTTRKMKMVVKELLSNPLNGEVDFSMKWCQCALVKDGVLKTI